MAFSKTSMLIFISILLVGINMIEIVNAARFTDYDLPIDNVSSDCISHGTHHCKPRRFTHQFRKGGGVKDEQRMNDAKKTSSLGYINPKDMYYLS